MKLYKQTGSCYAGEHGKCVSWLPFLSLKEGMVCIWGLRKNVCGGINCIKPTEVHLNWWWSSLCQINQGDEQSFPSISNNMLSVNLNFSNVFVRVFLSTLAAGLYRSDWQVLNKPSYGAIRVFTDIHGFQRINRIDFGDFLTVLLMQPACWCLWFRVKRLKKLPDEMPWNVAQMLMWLVLPSSGQNFNL